MTQYLSLLVCTLYLLVSVDRVGSYFATIDAHAEECFFEKVAAGTRLALRFEVIEGGFLDIDVRIHGPDGNTVYQGDRESTGNYMFAAHLDGVYRYCFSNKMSSLTPKIIMFSMDVGIKQVADNTTSDADHNKLDEMIIELANSMTSVKHEQEYMQIRQRVHFMVNESTNNRVLLWSFFEAALLIAMTAGQVYYLRRFFEVRRIV